MSNSPLGAYANASGLITSTLGSQIEVTNGRLSVSSSTPASNYYLSLFLKRAQSGGTDSGAKSISNNPRVMPGYSGQTFIYRGYVLGYAEVNSNFNLGVDVVNVLTNITSRPEWLTSGVTLRVKFGDTINILSCKVITSTGVYGSQGIDETIISEIKGIPIIISGGDYLSS